MILGQIWPVFLQYFYKSLNLFMSTPEYGVETCPIGKSIKNGLIKVGSPLEET